MCIVSCGDCQEIHGLGLYSYYYCCTKSSGPEIFPVIDWAKEEEREGSIYVF